jgi:hypothetical protein
MEENGFPTFIYEKGRKGGEKPLFHEKGQEGSWILTLNFWNIKTSLQGLAKPPMSQAFAN